MYEYLVILYSIFLYFQLKWIDKIIKECKFVANPNREMKESWKPFARFDYNNWNKLEIYFCAAIIFPIRVMLNVSLLSFALTILKILAIGKNNEQPWDNRRLKIVKVLLIFIARSVLFVSGFYKLPTILKNYKDYDPDAKNIDSNVSLIVSNHVSFWDTIIYVYKFTPAYLSKDAVKNYPLIGPICSGLKTIYFNRSSESERKMIPQKISKRIEDIEKGENFTPLLIFPEGTTTNYKYIISFKRGAFDPLKPVKICCLKYYDRNFNLSNDELNIMNVIVLSLCQFYNKVEVIEFEGLYFPQMKEDQTDKQVYFQEKVRDIISRVLQCPKIDAGYRDYLELMRNQKKVKKE